MAAALDLRILPTNGVPGLDDFLQVRKQGIPSLKVSDPLSVVEMALEVEVERARATEALTARDAAIQRLSDAYVSLRQKIAIIERLQQAPQDSSSANEQIVALELTIKTLREEFAMASNSNVPVKSVDLPPSYDEVRSASELSRPTLQLSQNGIDHANPGNNAQLIRPASRAPLRVPRETPPPSRGSDGNDLDYQAQILQKPDPVTYHVPKSSEPEDIIKARHAMLAMIPLPADPPDDTLKPIVIPPPFTLHEFLANASGVPFFLFSVSLLSNYRVLQELTTSWCPDREEHGYLLTPLFKCSTNPRVATAHRWNMVDVMARMNKPTECFYNKDGNWHASYYAGVYKAFRLDDLTTREWEALSSETTQALIKDTIAGRKNTSPQNLYETSQLYAAGALRVACLGLQCVGFNKAMYRAVLEQAAKCAIAGKWKGGAGAGAGLGPAGAVWNAAGEVVDGIAGMSISGNENMPVQGGKAKK
ncbi:hypothetical protein DFH07DRAFT_911209 [Mycena maculata]|uniref:DUF6697 domain-containing protein n=1 Tax=Mycena maculata TaxID=230809 RepID=A0AAD7K8A0_9AGAR|nr:hypothetical protein DFH07DRAFT_911209 [Mycena maculata]